MGIVRLLPLLMVIGIVADVLPAQAQPARRLEVGAQFSALRLSDLDTTSAGVGARLGVDLSPRIAIEGDANFFPNDRAEVQTSPLASPDLRVGYTRRRLEAFIGPKIGVRRERFGVFATVRPGFARLTDRGVECLGDECALVLLAAPKYRTEFAVNMGGVLELYPTARTVARLDIGTTMIRHRSTAPPCADCTSRNFSSRLGIGLRF